MTSVLLVLAQLVGVLAAAVALALAGWLLSRRSESGPEASALGGALAIAATSALADAGFSPFHPAAEALQVLSALAWLWLVHRLFGKDDRHATQPALRFLLLSTVLVEVFQLLLVLLELGYAGGPGEAVVRHFATILRLLSSIGALVLVHNLYAGASVEGRQALRWPAAGLATIWLYDLNLATVAYLVGDAPEVLAVFRSAALLAAVLLLALGVSRAGGARRFSPSRSVAFQSFSLLLIGVYLMAMLLVTEGLSLAGSQAGRTAQFGFLAVAGALAVVVLPSAALRGRLRVTLAKHLFQHRYDYRAEWLRFNDTMGRADSEAANLRERVIKALADVTDSPAGALLAVSDDGGLQADARWQWPRIELPARALDRAGARFFEEQQFIVDLDHVRAGRAEQVPAAACPAWLLGQEEIWAAVPLLHFDRLLGVVLLARPPVARELDWEDFDLLRVVGRQLASYLAEQESQDALGEAQRFDEFNRRIAFVMHDIKNLTSQLSLLARNAERHADKPEFRADMLVTLRNSADKLEALLARLGRYRAQGSEAHGGDASGPVELGAMLKGIAARCSGDNAIVLVGCDTCTAVAERDGLEQALVHLVHNAIDASAPGSPVFLDLREDGGNAVIEVIDTGSGMSAEFIRTALFRPFQSTKAGGFGIGAYEARALVHAMGGRLDVFSREGLGTRFQIHLPLVRSACVPAEVTDREVA